MQYTKPLANLIDFFQRFPSIGPKSAQRMALYLLKMPLSEVEKFADIMVNAKSSIHYCKVCFNMSSLDPCEICQSTNRDHSVICVVSQTKDLIAIERTNEYKGVYHVLQGLISPIDGIGAQDLRIKELLQRITDENKKINEVILALNPTVEGEATSLYLSKILKPFNIKTTRIASGLPVGADLEYADDMTITKALEGRKEI